MTWQPTEQATVCDTDLNDYMTVPIVCFKGNPAAESCSGSFFSMFLHRIIPFFFFPPLMPSIASPRYFPVNLPFLKTTFHTRITAILTIHSSTSFYCLTFTSVSLQNGGSEKPNSE